MPDKNALIIRHDPDYDRAWSVYFVEGDHIAQKRFTGPKAEQMAREFVAANGLILPPT